MSLIVNDLAATVRATKRELKAQLPDVKKVFAEVEEHMRREVDDVVDTRERRTGRDSVGRLPGGARRQGDRCREGRRSGGAARQ